MNNRKPLSDEDIEAESRNDDYLRDKKTYDAATNVIVICIYLFSSVFVAMMIYFAYLYCVSLNNPNEVSKSSIDKIEAIVTHVVTAVIGYVAHVVQRTIKKEK